MNDLCQPVHLGEYFPMFNLIKINNDKIELKMKKFERTIGFFIIGYDLEIIGKYKELKG